MNCAALPTTLTELRTSDRHVTDLSYLTNLRVLHVNQAGKLERLPDSLEELEISGTVNLRDVANCHNLKKVRLMTQLRSIRLPDTVEEIFTVDSIDCTHLTSLRILRAKDAINLPPTIENLDLDECDNLSNLTDLTRLKVLKVGKSTKLSHLPDSLEELDLSRCPLVVDLSHCRNLRKIRTFCCSENIIYPTVVTELKCSHHVDCQTLANLQILGCFSATNIPKTVTKLDIGHDKSGSLVDLSDYTNLQRLTIANFEKLERLPPNLIELDVRSCDAIADLSNLHLLKKLTAYRTKSLVRIPENLLELELTVCPLITDLSQYSTITSLEVSHLKNLTRVPVGLRKLNVMVCLRISNIHDCASLRELDMFGNTRSKIPTSVEILKLTVYGDGPVDISHCTRLRELTLQQTQISKCSPTLESLTIRDPSSLFDLRPYRRLSNLDIIDPPAGFEIPPSVEFSMIKTGYHGDGYQRPRDDN